MTSENQLQQLILKTLGSYPNYRIFRNNVGRTELKDGRFIQFGLCAGSSDLIGLQKIKITKDMVGKDFARFIAIEVKSEKGKLSREQTSFIEMVKSMGGIAVVINDIDDIKKITDK